MKHILKFLDSKYGELILGLVCGLAYSVFIFDFILENTKVGGLLLILFVSPVTICGFAILIIKLIRHWLSLEQYKNIVSFVIMNIVVVIIAILLLLSMILFKY